MPARSRITVSTGDAHASPRHRGECLDDLRPLVARERGEAFRVASRRPTSPRATSQSTDSAERRLRVVREPTGGEDAVEQLQGELGMPLCCVERGEREHRVLVVLEPFEQQGRFFGAALTETEVGQPAERRFAHRVRVGQQVEGAGRARPPRRSIVPR